MRRRESVPRTQRVRWTALELGLLVASLLLLAGPVGGEAIRWLAPAPAAARREPPPTLGIATLAATDTPASPAATTPAADGPAATATAPASPTAPATATAAPSATAVEAPPTPGSAPLQLIMRVSASSVRPGEAYVYVLDVISASPRALQVVVRASIDGEVDLVAVETGSGSCGSANPIDCRVSVSRERPARISARVRVRPDAPPGSRIVSQAVAQDQQNNAAISEQVLVLVAPAPPPPTVAPDAPVATLVPLPPNPGEVARPPSPSPDSYQLDPAPPATATPRQAEPAPPGATAPPTSAPAGGAPEGPAATARPTTPTQALPAASATATAEATPPLPPTAALPTIPPEQVFPPTAGPMPDTNPITPLPATSTLPPTVGLAGLLFGLALVIHSARRVRRADADLSQRGTLVGPLAPLLDNAAQLQGSVAQEIERMRRQCQQLVDLLRGPGDRAE